LKKTRERLHENGSVGVAFGEPLEISPNMFDTGIDKYLPEIVPPPYEPQDLSQYVIPQQTIFEAFCNGLVTGAKANVNGLSSAVVSTVTIGYWDKVEPWAVNDLDRAYGYDTAFAFANASGNIAVGLASGGAGCWASRGSSMLRKGVGYSVKYMDIGGNVVGGGKSAIDIYNEGPNISNVAGLGGSALGIAGNVKMKCFTEGTQIVVGMEQIEDEHGNLTTVYTTVNIEDVKVGDLVYSYNTATGEVELCEVTSTLVKTSDHIHYLTIVDENGREQIIETTDVHPFWVVTDTPDLERAARELADEFYHENVAPGLNGFWVEAKDLRAGDVFLGVNGELSTLTNVVRVEQAGGIAVFNFTVEGNHNYFILAKDYEYGQTCVLVHNAKRCGIYEFADQNNPGKDYVGQARNVDKRIKQHQAAGKSPDISEVKVTEMPNADKTAREIAEHLKIQEKTGGVPARLSEAVSNQRDPIGPARIHLLNGGN